MSKLANLGKVAVVVLFFVALAAGVVLMVLAGDL